MKKFSWNLQSEIFENWFANTFWSFAQQKKKKIGIVPVLKLDLSYCGIVTTFKKLHAYFRWKKDIVAVCLDLMTEMTKLELSKVFNGSTNTLLVLMTYVLVKRISKMIQSICGIINQIEQEFYRDFAEETYFKVCEVWG